MTQNEQVHNQIIADIKAGINVLFVEQKKLRILKMEKVYTATIII